MYLNFEVQKKRKILWSAPALCAVLAGLFLTCTAASADPASMKEGWDQVPEILARIVPPTFPDKDFDITRYGAVGDGKTDCRQAFALAVEACNNAGGGRVVVPSGAFLSKGPIHLKSNVNLHVTADAKIAFGTDTEDYKPYVKVRWEGTECYNYSPLVYAYQQTNLAITGKGTLDGQAASLWAKWKRPQDTTKPILRKMGNDLVGVEERVFGDGYHLRPSMIQPFECQNILIEDVTVRDSPFWVIHPTHCDNVTVRGVNVHSLNTNNDGCDPDSCRDVLIENCEFYCGDDSIAIKAGRDQDAWRVGRASENIVVRNCSLDSLANGLCIGSEMSGGVRNIFMEDCVLTETGSALFFKSNLDRGGAIENVWIRNIELKNTERLIRFMNNYHGYRGNFYPTQFRNFMIENIDCETASREGIHIVGVEKSPIENINLRNVNLASTKSVMQLKYVEDVTFENVTVNGELLPVHPELASARPVIK